MWSWQVALDWTEVEIVIMLRNDVSKCVDICPIMDFKTEAYSVCVFKYWMQMCNRVWLAKVVLKDFRL